MSLLIFIGIQVALFLVTAGLGGILVPRTPGSERTPLQGFAAMLAVLPLLHLFLPMGWSVGACILAFAFAGAAAQIRRGVRLREAGSFLVIFLLLEVIIAWPLAMGVALHYDWGLYYQQAQKWAVTCPVVPGLGNLHGRLAFPGANFLLAGLLDSLASPPWGARILGGFVVGLVLSALVWIIYQGWRDDDGFSMGFGFAGLLGFVGCLQSAATAVAAPDMISGALILLFGGHILRAFCKGELPSDGFLMAMSAGLFVLKLSNLPFLAALWAVLFLHGWRPRWISIAFLVPIPIGWALHNWIATGYPVFPYGMAFLQTDWAMSPGHVEAMRSGVKGWARAPGPGYLESLEGWSWFPAWFERFRSDSLVLTTAGFILLGGVGIAILSRTGRTTVASRVALSLFGASSLALLLWFLAAPDIRFALGIFWLAGALSLGMFLEAVRGKVLRRSLLVLAMISLVPFVVTVSRLVVAPLQPRGDLVKVRLPSGLEVFRPTGGDQVWNAPLPATPEAYDLYPRDSSLCDGFRDGSLVR